MGWPDPWTPRQTRGCISCPRAGGGGAGGRVSPVCRDLVPRCSLFLYSPGAGIFVVVIGGFFLVGGAFWCLVFFLLHMSWQALTSVAVSQRECSGAAKREETRGGQSRDERCSTPPPPRPAPPRTVLGDKRSCFARALRPASCVVGLLSATTSPCCLHRPCRHGGSLTVLASTPVLLPGAGLAHCQAWGREAPLLQSGHSGPCLRSPTQTLRHVLASPVSMILSVRLSICVFPALCHWMYPSETMHTSLWQPQSNPLHVGLNSQSSNIK